MVDDHEGRALQPQLIRRAAPHPAEAADDEVAFQFFDHFLDPPLSEKLIQLQLDDGLRHGSDGQQHHAHAEKNQERIEHPPDVAQRTNLAVTHGGHRGQRHVERIEHRIMFDENKPRRTAGKRDRQSDRDQSQAPRKMIHRLRTSDQNSGNQHQHAAHAHLERRRVPGRIHITMAECS